jgi:hypothetical protein
MAEARILMDGAYAYLAACYKRTTDHCIAELICSLSPGTWLQSSCRAGRFFQESLCTLPFNITVKVGAVVFTGE